MQNLTLSCGGNVGWNQEPGGGVPGVLRIIASRWPLFGFADSLPTDEQLSASEFGAIGINQKLYRRRLSSPQSQPSDLARLNGGVTSHVASDGGTPVGIEHGHGVDEQVTCRSADNAEFGYRGDQCRTWRQVHEYGKFRRRHGARSNTGPDRAC